MRSDELRMRLRRNGVSDDDIDATPVAVLHLLSRVLGTDTVPGLMPEDFDAREPSDDALLRVACAFVLPAGWSAEQVHRVLSSAFSDRVSVSAWPRMQPELADLVSAGEVFCRGGRVDVNNCSLRVTGSKESCPMCSGPQCPCP